MREFVTWRSVAAGLAFGGLLCAALYLRSGCSDADRQACLERGGRVLDVQGGRGGWVCDEPRRGMP